MESNLPDEVTTSPATREPRVPRFLVYLMGMVVVTCAALYWFVEWRPQYLELDIPPSEEMFWRYTERSILEWDGSLGAFLWRQEGLWRPTEGQDWHTIWSYFDRALTELGWVQTDDNRYADTCDYSAPETKFLERGDGGYLVYSPKNRKGIFCDEPRVCLVIWKADTDYFHIVLTSRNSSQLHEFLSCMG